jgi:molybdopterin-guanine dinucleotide biosynthesis protein B
MKTNKEKKMFPPFVSIVGNSGSGKTTFLEKLIPELVGRGLKVGTIKHDVHGFEMDKPGKDSWRHKHAGAFATVISSPYQIGMVKDVMRDHAPDELLSYFDDMDIILTEGYKRGDHPKMEIFRTEIINEPLCKNDKFLLALITDSDIDLDVPTFTSDAIKMVADFLTKHFNLVPSIHRP